MGDGVIVGVSVMVGVGVIVAVFVGVGVSVVDVEVAVGVSVGVGVGVASQALTLWHPLRTTASASIGARHRWMAMTNQRDVGLRLMAAAFYRGPLRGGNAPLGPSRFGCDAARFS